MLTSYACAFIMNQRFFPVMKTQKLHERSEKNNDAPVQVTCDDSNSVSRRKILGKPLLGIFALVQMPETTFAAAIKTLDMDLPTYGDIAPTQKSSIGIKMEEIAPESPKTSNKGEKKSKTKDTKAPRKVTKEEESDIDDNFEIIDMALPSYNENSKVEKNKSMFSL